jgi:polar amino acid transport system substrate-binding protein
MRVRAKLRRPRAFVKSPGPERALLDARPMRHRRRHALPLAAALALLACGLPRDPDGTLERVRGGTLRVGVVVAPPWTEDSAGTVGGVEGALVGALARELGARVQWARRPAHELIGALHARELDLVVGGLTADLAWKHEVAFTKPYYTDTVVVGVDRGAKAPFDLDGVEVLVEAGSPVAGDLSAKGAAPRTVPRLAGTRGALAAPTWHLAALGRDGTDLVLRESAHVLAAAPGENAFLMVVERLLRERRGRVPALLRLAPP